MAHTSLRPALVLAVLLSLACSTIAGRHLLQFGTVITTAIKRYEAWSTVSSSTGVLTGSSSLRADVTPVSQTLTFSFSVAGIAVGKTPSVSTPGFYTSDTNALVKSIPCAATADTAKGTWSCTNSTSTTLTSTWQPVDPLKMLIDAGVFTNPAAFYVRVRVDGVYVKGTVNGKLTTIRYTN